MTAAFENAPDAATYLVNGPVLRFVLRILGWSQAEFGRRIGVHESTAGRMLAGAPTSAAVARRIHAAIPGLTIPEIVWLPGFSSGLPPGAIPGDPRPAVEVEPDPADIRTISTVPADSDQRAKWDGRVDLVHGSDEPPPQNDRVLRPDSGGPA